jgi:hypothetical protein
MNPLAAYRDDGPLAALVGRTMWRRIEPRLPASGRLAWLVPPLVRTIEYGGMLGLAIYAGPAAVTACFVLLAVLAYHHYNTVYRLWHQHRPPPRWLRWVGGGWELRLIVAAVLAATAGLAIGMIAGAAGLAVIYTAETVHRLQSLGRTQDRVAYEQGEVGE